MTKYLDIETRDGADLALDLDTAAEAITLGVNDWGSLRSVVTVLTPKELSALVTSAERLLDDWKRR